MSRMRALGIGVSWAALTGSLAIAACDSPTAMIATQEVATSLAITVNGSASTPSQLVLEVGDTVSVTATATNPLGLAVSGGPVTWASADTSIVRVDAAGLVTAVGVGTSEVRATSGEASASLPTMVNDSATF